MPNKRPMQVEQDACLAVAESLKKQAAIVNTVEEQVAEAAATRLQLEAAAQAVQGDAKASA